MSRNTYKRSLVWCLTAMLAGLIAEHVLGPSSELAPRVILGAAIVAAVCGIAAARSAKLRGYGDLLVSIPFIVTVLSLITSATIAGTLIPQRVRPAQLDQIFGRAAGGMRALFLDDLFHSLWFSSLLILTCTCLVVTVARRWPWTWKKAGSVAVHLGVVVIALGALLGRLGGFKGRVDLEVGRVSDQLRVAHWRTGQAETMQLPFSVRLDDFRIETHDPAYRIYVFERTAPGETNESFKPLLSVAPEAQQGQRIAVNERLALRVEAYAEHEQGEPAEPQHRLTLNGRSLPVQPHQSYPDLAGRYVAVGDFLPHFTFDIASKQATSLSDQPVNPALYVEIRAGGATGEVEYQGWLFAKMPGFSMAQHRSGGAAGAAPVPVYQLTGAQQHGPALTLAVLDGDQVVESRELWADQRDRHAVKLPGDRYVAVFRRRDAEAKNYYSTLSILQHDKVVLTQQISVNEPLSFGGYELYQANFDPQNLRYSGIEVVRDPGLWLVYGGLLAMLLGVVHIFYLRTAGRRERVAPQARQPGQQQEATS